MVRYWMGRGRCGVQYSFVNFEQSINYKQKPSTNMYRKKPWPKGYSLFLLEHDDDGSL